MPVQVRVRKASQSARRPRSGSPIGPSRRWQGYRWHPRGQAGALLPLQENRTWVKVASRRLRAHPRGVVHLPGAQRLAACRVSRLASVTGAALLVRRYVRRAVNRLASVHRFAPDSVSRALGALAALAVVLPLGGPAAAQGREFELPLARCGKVEAPHFPHSVMPEVRGVSCERASALVRRVTIKAGVPRLAGWSCRTRDLTDYSRPRVANRMQTRCTRDSRVLAWAWSVWI